MKNVLVVEDDPVVRKVTCAMLEIRGYTVSGAAGAEEGLRRARIQVPDCIVMDVCMPGMDGLSAIDAFRADAITRRIPILSISGIPADELRVEVLARGACGFLQKPFSIGALVQKVEEC